MPSYNRLTGDKRIELYALKKAELNRSTGLRGYRPKQAQRLASTRKAQAHSRRISQTTWESVDEMLGKDWSPE